LRFCAAAKLAKDANLNLLLGLFLYLGHDDWTANDFQHFVKPAVARGNIEGILVGNEDPDMIGSSIIQKYPQQAKRDFPHTQGGTSQHRGYGDWLAHHLRSDRLTPLSSLNQQRAGLSRARNRLGPGAASRTVYSQHVRRSLRRRFRLALQLPLR
jgi:hypothetical protein